MKDMVLRFESSQFMSNRVRPKFCSVVFLLIVTFQLCCYGNEVFGSNKYWISKGDSGTKNTVASISHDIASELLYLQHEGRLPKGARLAVLTSFIGSKNRPCQTEKGLEFSLALTEALTSIKELKLSIVPRDEFVAIDDELRFFAPDSHREKLLSNIRSKRMASFLLLGQFFYSQSSLSVVIKLLSVNDATMIWEAKYSLSDQFREDRVLYCDCSRLCDQPVDVFSEEAFIAEVKKRNCLMSVEGGFILLSDCVSRIPKMSSVARRNGYTLEQVKSFCGNCGGRLPTKKELEEITNCGLFEGAQTIPCTSGGVDYKCTLTRKGVFLESLSGEWWEKFKMFRCVVQ